MALFKSWILATVAAIACASSTTTVHGDAAAENVHGVPLPEPHWSVEAKDHVTEAGDASATTLFDVNPGIGASDSDGLDEDSHCHCCAKTIHITKTASAADQ